MSKFIEKTVESKLVFDGKVIKVFEDKVSLINEKIATREVVRHRGGVVIAAKTKEDELIFVNQFRYAINDDLLELPAGKLEENEDPDLAALRELAEETGAKTDKLYKLGYSILSPGFCDEILYFYVCEVTEFVEQNPDEDEFLDIIKIPFSKAIEMVMTNEIKDGKTSQLVLLAARHFGKI